MRPPTILDIVQAVIDVAPSHPEVAVWWYARAGVAGAASVVVVLEAREGRTPNAAGIDAELARRLGTSAVAVRMHRGSDETHALYRLLTTEAGRVPAGHPEGS